MRQVDQFIELSPEDQVRDSPLIRILFVLDSLQLQSGIVLGLVEAVGVSWLQLQSSGLSSLPLDLEEIRVLGRVHE